MPHFHRRSFLAALALAAYPLSRIWGQSDDKAPVRNHPPDEAPQQRQRRVAKITPDMKIVLTASVGDLEIFSGRSAGVSLELNPHPGKPKAVTRDIKPSKHDAKELARLPEGEFSLNGIPFSSPDSPYLWVIRFEEVHAPGVYNIGSFYKAMMAHDLDPKAPSPSVTIRLEGGGTIFINDVSAFNASAHCVGPEGRVMENLLITGSSIFSLK